MNIIQTFFFFEVIGFPSKSSSQIKFWDVEPCSAFVFF